jgi:glutathione S-transferase
MGTGPVITDGELVLAESGAVVQYVLVKYGEGRLALPPDRAHFAEYLPVHPIGAGQSRC